MRQRQRVQDAPVGRRTQGCLEDAEGSKGGRPETATTAVASTPAVKCRRRHAGNDAPQTVAEKDKSGMTSSMKETPMMMIMKMMSYLAEYL